MPICYLGTFSCIPCFDIQILRTSVGRGACTALAQYPSPYAIAKFCFRYKCSHTILFEKLLHYFKLFIRSISSIRIGDHYHFYPKKIPPKFDKYFWCPNFFITNVCRHATALRLHFSIYMLWSGP